eukprot:Selendium_serpulae@DN6055_c0_g1_i5.p1
MSLLLDAKCEGLRKALTDRGLSWRRTATDWAAAMGGDETRSPTAELESRIAAQIFDALKDCGPSAAATLHRGDERPTDEQWANIDIDDIFRTGINGDSSGRRPVVGHPPGGGVGAVDICTARLSLRDFEFTRNSEEVDVSVDDVSHNHEKDGFDDSVASVWFDVDCVSPDSADSPIDGRCKLRQKHIQLLGYRVGWIRAAGWPLNEAAPLDAPLDAPEGSGRVADTDGNFECEKTMGDTHNFECEKPMGDTHNFECEKPMSDAESRPIEELRSVRRAVLTAAVNSGE